MFGLTGFKLGGIIAGLVAIIAALTWLVATVRDRDRLQGLEAGHKACSAALAGSPKAGPVAAVCESSIAMAVAARDDAAACDAALGDATGRSDYEIRMTCPANVKRLQADVVTLTADAADSAAQLTAARADTASAVTRGEARTATANTRNRNAQAALSRASIGADGLIRCAGDCLRALAGDAPGDAAPRP